MPRGACPAESDDTGPICYLDILSLLNVGATAQVRSHVIPLAL